MTQGTISLTTTERPLPAIIHLTAEQLQENLMFQAFEMVPTLQISNVLTTTSSLDVSGEGEATALDALMMINFLARQGEGEAGTDAAMRNCDANLAGDVSALDALVIINQLSGKKDCRRAIRTVCNIGFIHAGRSSG